MFGARLATASRVWGPSPGLPAGLGSRVLISSRALSPNRACLTRVGPRFTVWRPRRVGLQVESKLERLCTGDPNFVVQE